MVSTESVNELVKELCMCHLGAYHVATTNRSLLRLKSQAFNTFLRCPKKSSTSPLTTVEKLSAFAFQLRQQRRYIQANKLDNLIDHITKQSNTTSEGFNAVLNFLLQLSNSEFTSCKKTLNQITALEDGVNSACEDRPTNYGEEIIVNSKYFMQFPNQVFETIQFENDFELEKSDDVFELMPGMNKDGCHLSCVGGSIVENNKTNLFNGLRHCLPTENDLNVTLQFPELSDFSGYENYAFDEPPRRTHKISQTSEDEGFLDQDPNAQASGDLWEKVASMSRRTYFTWETIGRHNPKIEKPFVSECGHKVVAKFHEMVVRNLIHFNPHVNDAIAQPQLISQHSLVIDAINLLIGVPSVNFIKNGSEFEIKRGIHLEGVTPISVASLLSHFISTANNYVKLRSLSTLHSSIHHQGLVSLAFRSSINQFLSSYQATVLSLDSNMSLIELNVVTSKLRDQIHFLASFCWLDAPHKIFPYGVDLLSHIYETATCNWNSDNYALLVYILRTSCRPYFRFLQDWLFEGKCEDMFGEYMIQADEVNLSNRDRSYWTHGYVLLQPFVEDGNVPIFLRNIGKDIFLCGKSLNLLKLCDPNHVLCKIDPSQVPLLNVTFSRKAMQMLNEKCDKYRTEIKQRLEESDWMQKHHLSMQKEDRRRQIAEARRQAEEAHARIQDQAMEDRKKMLESKKKQLDNLKNQMEEDIARRNKTKQLQHLQDAALAHNAQIQMDNIMQLEREQIERAQNESLQIARDNLQLAKLRKRQLPEDKDSVCRMSLTEDDDGSPKFNLNDFKADTTKDTNFITNENFGNLNDDQINSNIICIENQVNRQKNEGLVCSATDTIMNNNQRNPFGHVSDSTIKDLIYYDNINRNVPDEADGGDDKFEPAPLDEACDGVASPEDVSPSSDGANVMTFSYVKDFPSLDCLPDPRVMNGKLPSAADVEDDDDVTESLNLPLSVLLRQSLMKTVSTQVNLVNKSVVDYFMNDLQINEHFKALRNFLFLHDGEFGHMLGQLLFREISSCTTSAQVLNPMTLNKLLAESLASSICVNSAFADNLSFCIKRSDEPGTNPFDLLNCLQLSYAVSWPHNIIITDKDMVRYNKVFTFIMQIKYSISALNEVFYNLKRQSVCGTLECSPQFRQLQIYRHEMQHFARVLQSYVVSQVLQATWQDLQRKLETEVRNIDDLRKVHSAYLYEACFKCLLNDKAASVMKIIQDVFAFILKFRTLLLSADWQWSEMYQAMQHPKFQQLSSIYETFYKYTEFLCKVLKKLEERGYQPHFREFLLRLDFNEHYLKANS